MEESCKHLDAERFYCIRKKQSIKRLRCTMKCYSYEHRNTVGNIKPRKMVWIDASLGKVFTVKREAYIGGIHFFTIEQDSSLEFTLTPIIPSFTPQKCKTEQECRDHAVRVMEIYIRRIADV